MKVCFNSALNNYYNYGNSVKKAEISYPQNNKKIPYEIPSYNLYSFPSFRAQKANEGLLKELKEAEECFKNEEGKFSLDKAVDAIKDKMDLQLMLYSEGDIKNIVKVVMSKNPDVKRGDVLRALDKLSSFSNYESLSKIENILKEQNVGNIVRTEDLVLNNIFGYFALKYKKIINIPEKSHKKIETQGIIADRNIIKKLKEIKENNLEKFEKISDDINSGRIKIIIPDGWEAKTERGYVSYNVVGAWGKLTDDVCSVLKEQKNGKNPFTDDIIQDLKEIYGNDVPFYIAQNDSEILSESEIAKRLNTRSLEREDIKKFLSGVSEFAAPCSSKPKSTNEFHRMLLLNDLVLKRNLLEYIDSNLSKEEMEYNKFNLIKKNPMWGNANQKEILQIQELLSKILYCTLEMYSPRRMAEELRLLHKKLNTELKNNNIDGALYIVPHMRKSFGLVNYQYSKVNNLPQNLFISINKSKTITNSEIKRGKCFVCLDDFSETGKSLLVDYPEFQGKNEKQPFIFAPLCCTKSAQENIEKTIQLVKRSLPQKKFAGGLVKVTDIKDADDYIKLLPYKKRVLLKYCFDTGFADGLTAVYFPHVVPDNCSDLAGLLFEKILKNELVNKAKMNYYKKSAIEYIIKGNNN